MRIGADSERIFDNAFEGRVVVVFLDEELRAWVSAGCPAREKWEQQRKG
jgi:hypothetical protein